MPDLNPQQFVEKWARAELKERASYQEHFMDLCHLVEHATPAQMDPDGTFFTFEAGVKTTTGGQGYADVWYMCCTTECIARIASPICLPDW